MANFSKSWHHLFAAVLALSTEEGPIDRRLQNAYVTSLQKISTSADLPPHLQKEFADLMAQITAFFQESAHGDSKRASALAKRVVALYDRVTKNVG